MTEERTYSLAELKNMRADDAMKLFLKAVKIEGTMVVRDKHGKIKYDNPELAGTYGEDKL